MGSKGPMAATSQPMEVKWHKLGGLSRRGEVCSHLLPFVCTDFYRLPVVCFHSQQFLGGADALSAVSPGPGGDECEQGSSQPRSCPTFRSSKRCSCVPAWHNSEGSWCPETQRRCRGTQGHRDTAVPCSQRCLQSCPITDRERLAKGWTQARVPGLDSIPNRR